MGMLVSAHIDNVRDLLRYARRKFGNVESREDLEHFEGVVAFCRVDVVAIKKFLVMGRHIRIIVIYEFDFVFDDQDLCEEGGLALYMALMAGGIGMWTAR